MKKYKAFLFDFDGTIINTNDFIVDSWKYVSDMVFGEMRFDIDYLASFFGTPLDYAVDETRKDYGIEGYTTAELCEIYRDYQRNNQDKFGEPFPGISEVLPLLKEKGALLGIVTSRTKHTTLKALERNGLAAYFDAFIAEEDTDIHKPFPEPCLLCCEKLGVSPAESLMIGDSRHDIECGNNAGADSALVAWSFCQKAEGLEGISKPTLVLEKAEDLLQMV